LRLRGRRKHQARGDKHGPSSHAGVTRSTITSRA
jgi:hypothetical protein